jgi:hypothetical protein
LLICTRIEIVLEDTKAKLFRPTVRYCCDSKKDKK